jgi:NADPH:quinone reductase-like Zn-dependent oxidoreductase
MTLVGRPALSSDRSRDLAGVVAASTVPEFAPGDRVIAMSGQLSTGLGTRADLVAAPARILTRAPSRIPLVDAAALPLAGLTAAQALDRLAPADGAVSVEDVHRAHEIVEAGGLLGKLILIF